MDTSFAAAGFAPLELGWFVLCLPCADLLASHAYYEKLGFRIGSGSLAEGWVVVGSGNCELMLFPQLPGVSLNFRGADITALAAELSQRGLEPQELRGFDPAQHLEQWSRDAAGNPLPLDGSGSFSLRDPDGNLLFFDTVPFERAQQAAGQRCSDPRMSGELRAATPLLGDFSYCLKVADLEASLGFYQRLGLTLLSDQRAAGYAVLGSADRRRGKLALYTWHIDGNLLNFRGGPVFELAQQLQQRGLAPVRGPETEADGSDGLWLNDPDGHSLYFNTAPDERLY